MQLAAIFLRNQRGDDFTALRGHARLQIRQSQVVCIVVVRRVDLPGLFQVGDGGLQIVLLNVKLAQGAVGLEAGWL